MNTGSELLAFIFARGGSKGLPGKNTRKLAGKPLVAHAIEQALASSGIGEVYLSTEDPQIAEVGREWGAEVPFRRPDELASDEADEIEAWRHAIRTMRARGEEFDAFVTTPATAPLRLPEDIDRCIERYEETDADLVVSVHPAADNPYFNMVVVDEAGEARLLMEDEDDRAYRRQDAPEVFALTPVAYVAAPEYVMETDDLLAGTIQAVEVPRVRAVDIDEPLDLEFAEFLWKKRRENH